MGAVSGLAGTLADYLQKGLGHIRVLREYPGGEHCLDRPAVAVGLQAVSLREGGLGNYYGERAGGSGGLYGGEAEVTVRLDLFAPGECSSGQCHRLYEAVCDRLLPGEGLPFCFTRTWCGPLSYDARAGAWSLRAHALFRCALAREDAAAPVEAFRVVRGGEG